MHYDSKELDLRKELKIEESQISQELLTCPEGEERDRLTARQKEIESYLYGDRGEIQTIPVDRIEVDPIFAEFLRDLDSSEFEGLKASIAEEGILFPLILWRRNGGYTLIDGHHRLRASRELGLTGVPAKVVAIASVEEAIACISRWQLSRRNLTPTEKQSVRNAVAAWNQFSKLHADDPSLTQKEAAKQLGVSASTLSRGKKWDEYCDRVEIFAPNASLPIRRNEFSAKELAAIVKNVPPFQFREFSVAYGKIKAAYLSRKGNTVRRFEKEVLPLLTEVKTAIDLSRQLARDPDEVWKTIARLKPSPAPPPESHVPDRPPEPPAPRGSEVVRLFERGVEDARRSPVARAIVAIAVLNETILASTPHEDLEQLLDALESARGEVEVAIADKRESSESA
jgi:ParB/RepB/Spo0J family partition protein